MDSVTRAVASGEDLYELLGVSADASDHDIRHAYRTLARRHHPDANPDVERKDGFRRIAAAYEVLGDVRERAAYDRAVRLERSASGPAVRHGPVATHVAPGPTGAVSSRGRAASANPADHAAATVRNAATRAREPLDEWRLASVFGRLVAAATVVVVIAVAVLMLVSASAGEAEAPPPPTIWCKTPDGWYDCWQATTRGP